MNITISLLKRQGLTSPQVDDITEHLEEEVELCRQQIKSLQSEVSKTNINIAFWKSEFKKRQPTKKCTNCKQPINLWPFEDNNYYMLKNKVKHVRCTKE